MQGKRQSADVNPNKYVPDKRDSRDAFSAGMCLRFVTQLEEEHEVSVRPGAAELVQIRVTLSLWRRISWPLIV